jgi:hypothetical protein
MRVKNRSRQSKADQLFGCKDDSRATQLLLILRGSRDCMRCGGLLVTERMDGGADAPLQQCVSALRCVQCGDVLDPVILRNRLNPGDISQKRSAEEDLWVEQSEEIPFLLPEASGRKRGSRVGGSVLA